MKSCRSAVECIANYGVPAEELGAFDLAIVGPIRVVAEYRRGERGALTAPATGALPRIDQSAAARANTESSRGVQRIAYSPRA